MDCVKDVVIPIVSAIIGGLFTVGGVYLTIRHERKKEKERIVLANKPLICRLDPMQQYDYKSAVEFDIEEPGEEDKGKIFGIIKNTDKAILIIDGVSVNGKLYKPRYGNVVDKNQIFYLRIYVSETIKETDDVLFIIKDIMENTYKYKLEIKSDKKEAEIIGLKEI